MNYPMPKDDGMYGFDFPNPSFTMPNKKCHFHPDLWMPAKRGTSLWDFMAANAAFNPWFKKGRKGGTPA